MPVPFAVNKRAFAVEPITGLMLPDGIFDIAIRRQLISVYVENASALTIGRFWARIPRSSDYTLTGQWQIDVNDDLVSGASTLLQWEVTFRGASPGKKSLRIEFGGMSIGEGGKESFWDGYTEARYFLASTTFDEATGEYRCEVPEGSLSMVFENSLQAPPTRPHGAEGEVPPIQFPQRFKAVLTPGGLAIPFDDPWWKVVAWIIAAIAALGAIVEAKEGNGAAVVGIGGHGHDNPGDYVWCVPDPTALGKDNYMTPAGALSAIANGAMLVGLADDADPWERGRIAANLQANESPITERVSVELDYPAEMRAGSPFNVGARWTYEGKFNTGRVAVHSVDEVQPNVHLAQWEIDAPKETLHSKPIIVSIRGTKAGGDFYRSDELYAFAIFISPDEHSFRVPLLDDGGRFDSVASDGWFTGAIVIEELIGRAPFNPIGEWRVQFVVQDVNGATADMPPKEAAQHIGGALLMAPISASQTNGAACTAAEIIRIIVKRF